MLFEHTSNWNNVTGGFGLAINSDGYNSRPNRFHTNHNSQRPRNYTKEIIYTYKYIFKRSKNKWKINIYRFYKNAIYRLIWYRQSNFKWAVY